MRFRTFHLAAFVPLVVLLAAGPALDQMSMLRDVPPSPTLVPDGRPLSLPALMPAAVTSLALVLPVTALSPPTLVAQGAAPPALMPWGTTGLPPVLVAQGAPPPALVPRSATVSPRPLVPQSATPAASAAMPWGATPSPAPAYARVAAVTALGRAMFFDPALSASGRVSCATCHDPRFGFSAPNADPVQMGGKLLDRAGSRAVPGLTYAQFSPAFTEHHFDSEDEGDESIDAGPTGGFTWDGRASRARDQARVPLLSDFEMANDSPAQVVAAARRARYALEMRRLYGDDLFDQPDRAFAVVLGALEVFQQDPATFAPFSSKYDAVLRGQARLSEAQARGLALFEDPEKGNCANCHRSRPGASGALPLFTDYGLVAIGVPRNKAIPANRDPNWFDLGLCGPVRTDLSDKPDYCGLFKAPSLRNVALRKSFFHNGAMHSLRGAVAFYATRDTDPARWYPRGADGAARTFDDLPAAYHDNINVEPPFDRKPGDDPALTEADIDDIVAFLETLTDGYQPTSTASSQGTRRAGGS